MQYLKLTLSFHSQNQMPTQNQINLLLVIIYFSLQNSNETTYTVTLNVTYKQTNKWTKDFKCTTCPFSKQLVPLYW